MIKILYVFGGEKASGAEIVVERLMSNNKDFESHLFISPGSFAQQLYDNSKPYHITTIKQLKKLNRSKVTSSMFYIKAISNYFIVSFLTFKYVIKNRIDIIHANTVVTASYLLPMVAVCKLFRIKVKFVWSDHDLTYYSNLDNRLSSFCVKYYDITFVVSEAVKAKYQTNNKIIILYNGLDLKVFKPNVNKRLTLRKELKLNDGDIVFTIAAGIAPRKGQLSLCVEFIALSKKYSNVQLLIAGAKGEDNHAYTDAVLKIVNNNSNIYYLGKFADMPALYNASDILINNSDLKGSEPLGTTIYEAMACEKLVIATDVGGSKEIIDNEINGFLFKPDNKEALIGTLDKVIRKYNTLGDVKINARIKVKERFDIKVMISAYIKYINLLMGLNNKSFE
jgi:glycosyltransferase involved in cell wall biosynthesis